jgi:hypothetical protein
VAHVSAQMSEYRASELRWCSLTPSGFRRPRQVAWQDPYTPRLRLWLPHKETARYLQMNTSVLSTRLLSPDLIQGCALLPAYHCIGSTVTVALVVIGTGSPKVKVRAEGIGAVPFSSITACWLRREPVA